VVEEESSRKGKWWNRKAAGKDSGRKGKQQNRKVMEQEHGGELLSTSIFHSRSIQSKHFGSIHSLKGTIMKWYYFHNR